MNRRVRADSASPSLCVSPASTPTCTQRGFMDGDLFLAAKVGGTALTPELWGALAKRWVVAIANMQLLVTRLGRHVWLCRAAAVRKVEGRRGKRRGGAMRR